MPEPLLEVDGVDAGYGAVRVLRDVSMTVSRNEIVALVGPNGAGKSTTLLSIMGVVEPRAGDIRLGGESVVGVPTERIVRRGVALVPEGRHIFADLTVEENLRLGIVGRASADGLEDDRKLVDDLFPILGEFSGRHAGLLSGGQQQQLAVARALLARPTLLMLDEPSLGLAPKVIEDLLKALAAIRDAGLTVVLVEQRAEVAASFADRTYVIADGEISAELTPEQASDTERLLAAYLGP